MNFNSTGFVLLVMSTSRHYILVNEKMNWSDAQDYCRANHIDLATFVSVDEIAQLQREAPGYGSSWVGLYNDISSWRWSYQDEALGSFVPWSNNEPTNNLEDCTAFNPWGWFDCPCIVPFNYICFDGKKRFTCWYKKFKKYSSKSTKVFIF